MNKLKFSLTCLLFLVIFSIPVYASYLNPKWYWKYQKIIYVDEIVEINNTGQYIKFEAEILINDSIYNQSDWIIFSFSPYIDTYDIVKDYKDSITVQNSNWNGIYTSELDDSSNYLYNISLKSLTGWNEIIFKANFTLGNRVFKRGDFEYACYYISNTKAKNKGILYLIPNRFEVKIENFDGTTILGRTHQKFIPYKKYVNDRIDFYLKDKEEEKQVEQDEKTRNRNTNILFLVIGAILSLIVTIVYEKFIKKDKKIFGDIKIKKFKNYTRAIIKVFKKK